MKRNKIIVRINDLSEIEKYKKLGISNFLFAVNDLSIGYNSFSLDELSLLKENVYLLINRVFDCEGIDKFKRSINKLKFAKGIFFEDLGVYEACKNLNIPLIWNQTHFAVNSESINIWLSKVSSVVISNELEKSELINVINNAKGKVILPILGLNMAMYSRRYLLSFYNEFKNLDPLKKAILKSNDMEFLAIENNYGTVLFYNKYFNLINELDNFNDEKILFYYIDPNELKVKDVSDILDGKEINMDNKFYHKKTVYKVGDLDD